MRRLGKGVGVGLLAMVVTGMTLWGMGALSYSALPALLRSGAGRDVRRGCTRDLQLDSADLLSPPGSRRALRDSGWGRTYRHRDVTLY